MRLLIYAGGTYVYGMEIVLLELMRELVRRNVPVHAVISGWNDGHFPSLLEAAGVPFTAIKLGAIIRGNPLNVPLSWTIDAIREAPSGARKLLDLCRSFKPTHVIHNQMESAFVAMHIIGRDLKHVMYAQNNLPLRKSRIRGPFTFGHVDRVLCCSNFIRRSYSTAYPDLRAITVYNGCSAEVSQTILNTSLTNRPLRIGVVGQVSPHKRVHKIAQAVGSANELGLNAELHVFGSGDADFIAAIQGAGYAQAVHWHGYSKSRAQIYGSIDCLVCGNPEEPFGMTAIEAMSVGLPVVGPASGGTKEIVVHEQTGLLFSPDDVDSAASCLMRLRHDETRRAFGDAGRARYRALFTVSAMTNSFLDALSQDCEQ